MSHPSKAKFLSLLPPRHHNSDATMDLVVRFLQNISAIIKKKRVEHEF